MNYNTDLMQGSAYNPAAGVKPFDDVNGGTCTYGTVMKSFLRVVVLNTHFDNSSIPLAGRFRFNPL